MNSTPAPNKTDSGSGHSSTERYPGLMNHKPTAAKSTRIATLTATMMVSQRPISRAPKALTNVSSTTEATASDFSNSADGAVVTKVAA